MVGFVVGVGGGADGAKRGGVPKQRRNAGNGGFWGSGDSGRAGGFSHFEVATNQFGLESATRGESGAHLIVLAEF